MKKNFQKTLFRARGRTLKGWVMSVTLVMLVGMLSTAGSGDLSSARHEAVGTIDLVAGAGRGAITEPLLTGTIASTGQQVLFAIADASGKDFTEISVGDPKRGRVVFEQKRCVKCHSVNGRGGKIGPPLAPSAHPHPPIELAGMMWNHSPTMTALMGAMGIPRPVFKGNEMADLLAYLNAVRRQVAREHSGAAPNHDH